jgi:hypothetical protein
MISLARMVLPTTSRSTGPGIGAPDVVVEARILATPLRRARPLTLPAVAVIVVEGFAAH